MLDQPLKQWLKRGRGKREEEGNTKIWISRERKELFRWNKKHLSNFLKGYHLVIWSKPKISYKIADTSFKVTLFYICINFYIKVLLRFFCLFFKKLPALWNFWICHWNRIYKIYCVFQIVSYFQSFASSTRHSPSDFQ